MDTKPIGQIKRKLQFYYFCYMIMILVLAIFLTAVLIFDRRDLQSVNPDPNTGSVSSSNPANDEVHQRANDQEIINNMRAE